MIMKIEWTKQKKTGKNMQARIRGAEKNLY